MSRWAIFPLLLLLFALPASAAAQPLVVDSIVIEGNRRVDLSAIRNVLSVKEGESVSEEQIDQQVRALYRMGRFEDVVAAVETQDGKSVLTFRLVERPLVRKVVFEGNKELKDDKLRPLIPIKTPGFLDPRQLPVSVEAVSRAYHEEGYYAVEVVSRVDSTDRDNVTVTFEVTEGEKVLVRSIRFEGNTVFDDDDLRDVMETKKKWFLSWLTGRGTYKQEVLDNDLEIIADQYFNEGYVQVRVKKPLLTLSDDKEYYDLLIEIEEGEQFSVGQVDVTGDLIKEKDELLALFKLKPGDVFSRKKLRESVFAVNDLYSDQGYAYVNVSPLTPMHPETRLIDLVLDVEQGVQVTIGRIDVRGNTKTRDKVIRREMKVLEGDLFSSSRLKESRRRVNNLGFFDEVNLATKKGVDEEHMDIDVEVKERPTGTFSLGFGYSSVDGFIGQGSVSQENFLGRALKLNLSGSIGGSSTTYQVGILDPYFLDKNLSFGGDLYNTEREWTDFTKKTQGGDIKLGFPLSDDVRTFFVYRYEEKEILDVDASASSIIKDQEGESTLSSIYASLTRDTTDYRLDPTTGNISQLSVEFAGLGGTEKFSKYIVDHRYFYPFKWGTVFSVHGQVGYIQEIGGEEIPIDERFFLGGINTLRGFNSREVGPRVRSELETVDPVTGEVVYTTSDYEYIGGNKDAYFNLEYTFPLAKEMGLKGVLFFDTGNAWGEGEDYFEEMRYSLGGGIRWFSPLGPLRLEWGYNLDPLPGESRSEFEFSIGKFF